MRLAASVLCLVAFPSAVLSQVMRQMTPQDDFSKEAYVLENSHGDSDIMLRSAFRVTSESQWNELVQRISAGMGFAGTVSEVVAAQPETVGQPFWFSYSYHRPEYSNWKEHQITLPLPPLILPALGEKRKSLAEPVALGSPGEITYEAKVKFPKGMRPVVPKNVNVQEDFASYTATYSFEDGVLTGVRQLKTRMNEIPGSKRAAYSKFVDEMVADQDHFMPVTGGPQSGIKLTARTTTSEAGISGTIGSGATSIRTTINHRVFRNRVS
jgi:hypothetical protein